MNAAEALAEARRACAEQAARQPEIDTLAAQLADHLVKTRRHAPPSRIIWLLQPTRYRRLVISSSS